MVQPESRAAAPSEATTETRFAMAVAHHRAGRVAAAEALYCEILLAYPSHHESLFALSLLALQSGQDEAAVELLTRAVAIHPGSHAYLGNLGEAYRRLGRYREAADALHRALSRKRTFAEGMYNLALVLRDNGEIDGAIHHLERAADLKPDVLAFQQALALAHAQRGEDVAALGRHACAWLLSGRSAETFEALLGALARLGRGDAVAALTARERSAKAGAARARRERSKNDPARAAYEQALTLDRAGQPAAAIALYQQAADARPDDLRFQHALANALRDAGAVERCVAHYHAALAIDPRSVAVLVDLGIALASLGRYDGAAAMGERAVGLDPGHALAHASLGAVLVEQLRVEEGIARCERAIALDPACALAHFQLGNARAAVGLVSDAIEAYRKAIALDPRDPVAHSALLLLLSYAPGFDAKALFDEARAWARRHAEPLAAEMRAHANDPTPDRRLRIGYVSADLHDHPVAQFLLPLLQHHDRGFFAIHAYSSGRRADAVTARLRGHCDAWSDVSSLGDRTLAQRVRDDGIDVLVDLSVHTGGSRLRAFARKPAPVQICWLGHVGTTGVTAMDYRITDRFLDPPEREGVYAEAPLVLPDAVWCYAPPEPELDVGPLPAERAGYVTFGCQHSFHKIHDGVLALWARVLRAVPDSRLVLYAPLEAHGRTLDALAAEGIDGHRVTLVPRRPRQEYLRAYQTMDIVLDTFPYNGATTSLEAFWMGVPVVTLAGETAVGRAGVSLAQNLGLPELIATTADDFEHIAVDLAHDRRRLAELRAGLRARMRSSPLMDGPRFARAIEAAYRAAWRAWCARAPG